MLREVATLLFVVSAIVLGACKRAAAASDPIDGVWVVVEARSGGEKVKRSELAEISIAVGKSRVFWSDGTRMNALISIDRSVTPHKIDIKAHEEDFLFKLKGIFTIRRDRLLLCVDEKLRPTSFATQPGETAVSYVLERHPLDPAL
jgi:uncharacterized protein (TIGR03067 family)